MELFRWLQTFYLLMIGISFICCNPRTEQSHKLPIELTPSQECPESFLACSEGICISPKWICDGEKDCLLGEDEDEERCSVHATKNDSKADEDLSLSSTAQTTSEQNDDPFQIVLNHRNEKKFGLRTSRQIKNGTEKFSAHKSISQDEFIQSQQEEARRLIQETSDTLYQDPFLKNGSYIDILKTKFQKPEESSDSLKKGKSFSQPDKPSCCYGMTPDPQSSEHSEESQEDTAPHTLPHRNKQTYPFFKRRSDTFSQSRHFDVSEEETFPPQIEVLVNITEDLLAISEKLRALEISSGKDCDNKEFLELKQKNLISKLTCPHHFQFIIGSCIYVQVYPPVSWQEASSACASRGGQLVTIQSIGYYENLLRQLEQDKQRIYSFWIGATNGVGQWTWVDGSPLNNVSLFGFTLRKNSKNVSLSKNQPNQCAFLDGNLLSYLNGNSCLEEKGFICQTNTFG